LILITCQKSDTSQPLVSLPDLWHLRTLLGCGTACRSGTVVARSFFARVRVSCAWVWVLVCTVCLPNSADQKTPSEQAASVWASGWWTPSKRSLSWCWHFGERTRPPILTHAWWSGQEPSARFPGVCVCVRRDTPTHTTQKSLDASSREWVGGQLRACGDGQHL
jgi:hypothetical protein